MIKLKWLVLLMIIISAASNFSCKKNEDVPATTNTSSGIATKGLATSTVSNLLSGCSGSRVAAVGTIKSTDNTSTWIVPAETQYTTGTKASDLYNECSGVKLASISQLDLNTVPVTVIDNDGDVIAGYLFADNYFELYINGQLVAVDPVPYTPFNSNVVRFKVKKPYTIAIKLVDWEENLGLGSENNNGNLYHPGDGGLIANFSDGTNTNATWRAQTYYIAPIADLSTVSDKSDGTRSSASASSSPSCNGTCYGIHWAVPTDWNSKTYDDSGWPSATIYSNSTVGVDNKPAFTNFSSTWANASFIWSSNLILDNVVLVRKTVQ